MKLLFVRYLLVGLANTLLGLLTIFIAQLWCSEVVANLIGYLVVVPISFFSHRNLSFRDTGKVAVAFLKYLPTVLIGYGANFIALSSALDAALSPYVAQTLAISCHVLVTFFLSRVFVFLHPRPR